jgi:hypothetical protein
VSLPTAFPPLGEVRPFATQRGVVAAARMHDRVVVEAAEDLALQIIHQRCEVLAAVGLARATRKHLEA